MAGFFVSNFVKDVECFFSEGNDKCVKRQFNVNEYAVKQCTSKKFLNDKIFEQTSDSVFVIEGCVLNKNKLMFQNGCTTWLDTLERMRTQKEDWFCDFRGTFSGGYYNIQEDEWTFYTNHLGDHPVFYWKQDDKFVVSSDLNWLVAALKSQSIVYTLNVNAVKSLMSYGWVEGDGTIIAEVCKLLPGNSMKIKKGIITSIHQYHRFVNTKFTDQGEDEIIEEVDAKFRQAIALEYDKDKEYGYKHLACLSGGLDSRMNVWVAKHMGYTPVTTLTFGQSEGQDIQISNQIAARLHTPHLIKTLDDANFLKNIPRAVRMTYGLVEVSGAIHGSSMHDLINYDEVGMIHTGLIGDAILGSRWRCHTKVSSLVGKNGNVDLIPYDRTWENEELYFYYEHVFHATLGVQCNLYERAQYASPFTDIDFWEYCLTIPLRYRYNHYIYKKWILKKYPEAAAFDWEEIGAKITDSDSVIRFKQHITKYVRKVKGISEHNCGMNPFDYWYETIPEVREELDAMFEDIVETPLLEQSFLDMTKRLYHSSGCRHKIQLISALQSVKEYFA